MRSKREQDYIAKHQLIKNKLLEIVNQNERACADVTKLASQLKMDIRTVRAHLKIMEVDTLGVFIDLDEKQFCTKEGITLLANTLNLNSKVGN